MEANSENSSRLSERNDIEKKLKKHTYLSAMTIVLGVVVMLFFGYTVDEPNLISPSLIVIGIGWYIITRVRIRSHLMSSH